MRNLYHIMSASDDYHVRLFDLATSSTIMKLKAHKVRHTYNSQTEKKINFTLFVRFIRIIYDVVQQVHQVMTLY